MNTAARTSVVLLLSSDSSSDHLKMLVAAMWDIHNSWRSFCLLNLRCLNVVVGSNKQLAPKALTQQPHFRSGSWGPRRSWGLFFVRRFGGQGWREEEPGRGLIAVILWGFGRGKPRCPRGRSGGTLPGGSVLGTPGRRLLHGSNGRSTNLYFRYINIFVYSYMLDGMASCCPRSGQRKLPGERPGHRNFAGPFFSCLSICLCLVVL